jgi:Protein of unknown function (DUF3558)
VAALAPTARALSGTAAVRKLLTLVVAGLLAAVVAGCGSDDGDDAGGNTSGTPPPATGGAPSGTVAPSRPACEILTRDEVTAALGNPVRDPVPVGDQGCTWATDVDGGSSLDISAIKHTKDQAAFQCRTLRRGQPQEANREPVEGLGDPALWVWEALAAPIVQGSLVSCWEDGAVSVLITGEKDQAALRTTAAALAEKVHSRM